MGGGGSDGAVTCVDGYHDNLGDKAFLTVQISLHILCENLVHYCLYLGGIGEGCNLPPCEHLLENCDLDSCFDISSCTNFDCFTERKTG